MYGNTVRILSNEGNDILMMVTVQCSLENPDPGTHVDLLSSTATLFQIAHCSFSSLLIMLPEGLNLKMAALLENEGLKSSLSSKSHSGLC